MTHLSVISKTNTIFQMLLMQIFYVDSTNTKFNTSDINWRNCNVADQRSNSLRLHKEACANKTKDIVVHAFVVPQLKSLYQDLFFKCLSIYESCYHLNKYMEQKNNTWDKLFVYWRTRTFPFGVGAYRHYVQSVCYRAISPRIVLIPRVPDLFFSRSALFLQNKSGTCVH